MCRKLFLALGKVVVGLLAAYAVSRVCAQSVSHQEEVECEVEVANGVNEGEEEVGGDEVAPREERDGDRNENESVNSDEVVRMQGEVIVVEEVLESESDGVHNDEEDANWTLEREEVVTRIEMDVNGTEQANEEEVVMEDGGGDDQEDKEDDDEDLEVSEGEARLRGVVKVVEDIPIEDIVIVDGRFVRVKVDVRFDVRFQLDRRSTPNEPDSHGQAGN